MSFQRIFQAKPDPAKPLQTKSLFAPRPAPFQESAQEEAAFPPIHLGQDHSAIPFKPVHPAPALGPSSISCPFTPERCPFGGACHACPPKMQMQAKLKIGQPGDRYEQEADRVAEQVMRMPEPQAERKAACASCADKDEDDKLMQTKPLAEQITPLAQRKPGPEAEKKDEDDDELVQAKSASGIGNAQEVHHPLIQSVLASPGQPLDAGTRSFMEPRFGQDFSGVRVHVGGQAAESARAVNARAYTVGRDVVFGEGQYVPGSDEGRRLMAHELSHVAQQARHGDAVQPCEKVSHPKDTSEREADFTSNSVAAGASFAMREASSARIMRKITASAPEVSAVQSQLAFKVFELSSDAAAEEALAAFDAYIALNASDQERARSWSYGTGKLQKALAALGPVNAADPKYADAVHGILRWIKETQTGKTDEKMVKTQADFVKTKAASLPEWEGAMPTHRAGLLPAAQTTWTDRGNISSSEQRTVDQQSADKKLTENHSDSVATNQQADDYQHSSNDSQQPDSSVNAADKSVEESAAPAQAASSVSTKDSAETGKSKGKATTEAVEGAEGTPSEAIDPREAIAPATNAVRQRAAGARRHPSAATPVSSAQAAAKDPKTEQTRSAATQTVENIDAAGKEAKDVERQRFKNTLTEAINKATPEPKTESDAEKVMQQGAKEASQTLHGHLATERDAAAGPLKSAASTEVPPSAQPAQPQSELRSEQVGPPPAPVAAAPVVPEPLPPERLDYSSDHGPTDQLMAENNISPEQLKEGNEPAFGPALEARSAAEEHESTVEARYRQSESQVQEQAQDKAQQAVAQGLTGLHGERKLRIGQVAGQQTATQSKDAAERQRVTDQIKTIKDNTQADVNKILDSMATEADKVFKDGLDAAEKAYGTAFEEAKGGIGTWLTTWGDDWKSHIEASLKTARQKYLNVVGTAIDKVADLVGVKLADARQRVADGRKEVEKFVAGLDGSVKQYGEEALKAVSADFDSMESDIDKRRDGLIDKLTQQYKESYERMSAKEEQLRSENKSLWQRVYDATVGLVEKIIEFKNMLLGVLGRAADVVGDIIAHPIRFLGNLVAGVQLGLNNFVANIGRHLQQALMSWLFGVMAEAGIQLPEQFDLKGILSLVLQVLGLTYANIRKRAVNLLGEKLVSRLEQVAEIFKILITEGPGGLWEYIKEKLGNLKAMVLDEIERFVTESIVVAGIKWIVSLLNPAAAFIKACMAIYDIIKFFIERAAQVLALVNAIIESLAAIVAGNISGAAKFVEDALGKALPVVIGFLASLLGLGGISAKIKSIIEKIQQPVNTAIDWVINKAVNMVKAAGQLLGFGKEEPAAKEESPKTDDPEHRIKVQAGLAAIHAEEQRYLKDGKITRKTAEQIAAKVKSEHSVFKSIKVVDGGETWDYAYVASPIEIEPGAEMEFVETTPVAITQQINYSEKIDGNKRYKIAKGNLGVPSVIDTHRDKSSQKKLSKGTGDDAGHLIGNIFGGSGGQENLSLQNFMQNRFGTFRSLERHWASLLRDGANIHATVIDVFRNGEDRPFVRKVEWQLTRPGQPPIIEKIDFANTHTQESRSKQNIEPTVSEPQHDNVIPVDFANKTRL